MTKCIIAHLVLLQSCEGHLCTGNVPVRANTVSRLSQADRGYYALLGVLKVFEESVLVPCNALLDVGLGV